MYNMRMGLMGTPMGSSYGMQPTSPFAAPRIDSPRPVVDPVVASASGGGPGASGMNSLGSSLGGAAGGMLHTGGGGAADYSPSAGDYLNNSYERARHMDQNSNYGTTGNFKD